MITQKGTLAGSFSDFIKERERILSYRNHAVEGTILYHIQALDDLHRAQAGLDIANAGSNNLAHEGAIHVVHAERPFSGNHLHLVYNADRRFHSVIFRDRDVVDKHAARSNPCVEGNATILSAILLMAW